MTKADLSSLDAINAMVRPEPKPGARFGYNCTGRLIFQDGDRATVAYESPGSSQGMRLYTGTLVEIFA